MSDPIEVRIGGKTVQRAVEANDLEAIGRLSAALTTAARLAKTVRARAMRGRFATQPGAYSVRRPYIVSKEYGDKIGIKKRSWPGSKAFHAQVARPVANISGGMWEGIRVRNFGVSGAVIEFAGRSLGSEIKMRKRGEPNQRVMVANRKKAAQVYFRLKLNPLQPTDREIEGIGAAVTQLAAKATSFGVEPKITRASGDLILARELVADIEAGRVTRYL